MRAAIAKFLVNKNSYSTSPIHIEIVQGAIKNGSILFKASNNKKLATGQPELIKNEKGANMWSE